MTFQDFMASNPNAYAGWDPTAAAADFAKTGGSGQGNSGGGSGSSFNPLSPADIASLRTQAYNIVQPYYEQLAQQANGDFNTAVAMMKADYQQGVKQAKQNLAYEQKYGAGSLKDALDTLGVTFNKENIDLTDKLNTRGVAVYQQSPNGQPNVVQPASFNPTYDTTNYTFDAGVNANPNAANLGQGGIEAEQLRKDQQTRATAALRAGMKPLENAGIQYSQFTNPNSGFDINNPATSTQGTDLSQLGTSELKALENFNTATKDYRTTTQDLSNKEAQSVNDIAGQFATTGQKAIDTNTANQLQKEFTTNFVQGGLS